MSRDLVLAAIRHIDISGSASMIYVITYLLMINLLKKI